MGSSEFDRFSLWKEYEDVAMHFNDLLLRLRSQSLAAVAAFAAIAGALLRNGDEGVLPWGQLASVFFLLILFWIAIWLLDLLYYNRLLLGAVQALIQIESDSTGAPSVDRITLSTEIDKMAAGQGSCYSKQRGATTGVMGFYVVVLVALLIGLGGSLIQWCHSSRADSQEAATFRLRQQQTDSFRFVRSLSLLTCPRERGKPSAHRMPFSVEGFCALADGRGHFAAHTRVSGPGCGGRARLLAPNRVQPNVSWQV